MKTDERCFILVKKAAWNGWTTEDYCEAGGFTSRFFIIEATLGKSRRILVILLPHET